jgi:hypothetical protein
MSTEKPVESLIVRARSLQKAISSRYEGEGAEEVLVEIEGIIAGLETKTLKREEAAEKMSHILVEYMVNTFGEEMAIIKLSALLGLSTSQPNGNSVN